MVVRGSDEGTGRWRMNLHHRGNGEDVIPPGQLEILVQVDYFG